MLLIYASWELSVTFQSAWTFVSPPLAPSAADQEPLVYFNIFPSLTVPRLTSFKLSRVALSVIDPVVVIAPPVLLCNPVPAVIDVTVPLPIVGLFLI